MGSKLVIGILGVAIVGMLYVYGVVIARVVNENSVLGIITMLLSNDTPARQDNQDNEVITYFDEAQPLQSTQEQAEQTDEDPIEADVLNYDDSSDTDAPYFEGLRFEPSQLIDPIVHDGIIKADEVFDLAKSESEPERTEYLREAINMYESLMLLLDEAGMNETTEYEYCLTMIGIVRGELP